MKKIARIKKGEEIIVQVLPEDLQDLFDKMTDVCDEYRRAEETYKEEASLDNAKFRVLLSYAADDARNKFWGGVHARYGNWDKNLGVRDGYSLVTFGDDDPDVPDFIKKLMGDMRKLGGDEPSE